MANDGALIDALDARVARREGRRDFFRAALGGAAVAAAGVAAVGLATPAAAQSVSQPSEADVLNFALNLEYLEAQFYSYAANGTGLPQNLLGGTGTPGTVTGGRQVQFSDRVVAQYAREIAADELAHVQFLRTTLGAATAVAMPSIDIGTSATGAFAKAGQAAQAAGLVLAGQTFDPYANDESFLLGAFLFEDVGVTAYKGSSGALINNKAYVDAAAGILAAEAFHAGLIRNALYQKGIRTSADAISKARDTLDGGQVLDQGVSTVTVTDTSVTPNVSTDYANIAPTDLNGIAFSRTAGQVLGIVYLNATAGTTAGGFFPAGVNGTIKASAA